MLRSRKTLFIKKVELSKDTSTNNPAIQFVFDKKNYTDVRTLIYELQQPSNTLQYRKLINDVDIIVRYTGYDNVITVINNFIAKNWHSTFSIDFINKIKKFAEECENIRRRRQTSQLLKIPSRQRILINPTDATQNRILCDYLDYCHQSFFQQFTPYVTCNFDFILTHSLVRKIRLDKNRQLKRHPITQHPTYSYVTYSSEDIIGSGGTSIIYNALGRLKPHKSSPDTMRPRAYFPYPKLPNNKSSKNLKSIDLTQTNEIKELLIYEHAILKMIAYSNPSEITYLCHQTIPLTAFILQNTLPGIELFDFINNEARKKPLADLLTIAINLVTELNKLHQQGIVHKDIKPENIFIIPDTYQIYLLDFGFSRLEAEIKQSGAHGTTLFIAPELMKEESSFYSAKLDNYSMACVLRLLFNDPIFYKIALIDDFEFIFRSREKEFIQKTAPVVTLSKKIKEQFNRIGDYQKLCDTLSGMSHGHPDYRLTLIDALHSLKEIHKNVVTDRKFNLVPNIIEINPTLALDSTQQHDQQKLAFYLFIAKNNVKVLYQNEVFQVNGDFFKLTHTLIYINNRINDQFYAVCTLDSTHLTHDNVYVEPQGKIELVNNTDESQIQLIYSSYTSQPKLLRIIQADRNENIYTIAIAECNLTRKKQNFSSLTIDQPHNRAYLLQDKFPHITLEKLIEKIHGREMDLPFTHLLTIYINLLQELHQLHVNHGIIHCDLQPRNIIINLHTYEVTIINFNKKFSAEYFLGNILYTAPEIAANILHLKSYQLDIYAVGMIGRHLFYDINFVFGDMSYNDMWLLEKKQKQFLRAASNYVKLDVMPFIGQMHGHYTAFCNILSQLSENLPANRLSLKEAIITLKQIHDQLTTDNTHQFTADANTLPTATKLSSTSAMVTNSLMANNIAPNNTAKNLKLNTMEEKMNLPMAPQTNNSYLQKHNVFVANNAREVSLASNIPQQHFESPTSPQKPRRSNP